MIPHEIYKFRQVLYSGICLIGTYRFIQHKVTPNTLFSRSKIKKLKLYNEGIRFVTLIQASNSVSVMVTHPDTVFFDELK